MQDLSFTAGNFEAGMYGNRQREFNMLGERSQAEILDYCHAYANMMNQAKDMQVVTVTEAGTIITYRELRREVCAMIACAAWPVRYDSRSFYFPRSVAEIGW